MELWLRGIKALVSQGLATTHSTVAKDTLYKTQILYRRCCSVSGLSSESYVTNLLKTHRLYAAHSALAKKTAHSRENEGSEECYTGSNTKYTFLDG